MNLRKLKCNFLHSNISITAWTESEQSLFSCKHCLCVFLSPHLHIFVAIFVITVFLSKMTNFSPFLPPSNTCLLLMHTDVIKSKSSFTVHRHNRSGAQSGSAFRASQRMCYKQWLSLRRQHGPGRHLQSFIHKCIHWNTNALYCLILHLILPHKPENGLSF